MESPQSKIIANDRDMHKARATASQVMLILDRFVPTACREEAFYYIVEVCYKEGIEFRTKLERNQYEAQLELLLKTSFPPTIIKEP